MPFLHGMIIVAPYPLSSEIPNFQFVRESKLQFESLILVILEPLKMAIK